MKCNKKIYNIIINKFIKSKNLSIAEYTKNNWCVIELHNKENEFLLLNVKYKKKQNILLSDILFFFFIKLIGRLYAYG